MRKSTALLVLVSIVCATAAGCAPYADRGPIALAPRIYPFIPQAQTTPPTTLPEDPPVSYVQR